MRTMTRPVGASLAAPRAQGARLRRGGQIAPAAARSQSPRVEFGCLRARCNVGTTCNPQVRIRSHSPHARPRAPFSIRALEERPRLAPGPTPSSCYVLGIRRRETFFIGR